MRFKRLFLLVLFLCQNGIYAQNEGVAVYRILSEKVNLEEGESASKQNFVKILNSMSSVRDSLRFNLEFKGQEAVFYLDKTTDIGLSNEKFYNSLLRSFSSIFYRNNNSKELIEQINSDGFYLVTSSTDDLKWQITKDEKRIDNQLCFKAVTYVKDKSITKGEFEEKVEAWFCPAIAISLGPKNFGGLPGLILELKQGKFTYYLETLSTKLKKNRVINKPIKGKILSRQEYLDDMLVITRENFNGRIGN